MKRQLLLSASLLAGFGLACSCVNLEKLREYPEPRLYMDRDILLPENGINNVDITADIPEQFRNTNTSLRFAPFVSGAGGQLLELPPFVVEGRNGEVFNERTRALDAKYFDGVDVRTRESRECTQADYSTAFDHLGWMDNSTVYADLYAEAYTKSVYLGRYRLGCIPELSHFIDRSMYEKFYYGASMPDGRIICGGDQEPITEGVVFRQNSSVVKSSEKADRSFREHVARIASDPEVSGYRVSIFVSNSPEGTVEYNRELGEKRVEAMLRYALSVGVSEAECEIMTEIENWSGLEAWLRSSSIEHKSDIARIIGTTSDLDARENLIRKEYPEAYAVLVREAYPSLRRGDISITATYKGEPGKEYMHTYATTEGAVNSFVMVDGVREDISVVHTSMLDAVKRGDYKQAAGYADRIPNTGTPDVMLLNKSTVYAHVGRTEEAKALLKRLTGRFPEARYNLGTLQLVDGEYAEAESNLDGIICLNGAISDIYVSNNREAIDNLLLMPKSPKRDYLLAVAYERVGKEAESSKFLAEALRDPAVKRFHDESGCLLTGCGSAVFERAPAPAGKKAKAPKVEKAPKVKEPKAEKIKEPKAEKPAKVKEPKPEKVKEPKAEKVKKVKEPKPEKVKAEKTPKIKEPKPEKVKAEKPAKVKEPKPEKVKELKAERSPKVKKEKPAKDPEK